MSDMSRWDDITKGFNTALGTYPGNATFGQSFLDQYRNANAGIGFLRGVDTDNLKADEKAQYGNFMSGAKGMKGDAIAGGVIAGLNGLASIGGSAIQASQINDTSGFSNQIDDLGRVGTFGYNNYDEIARDYQRTDFDQSIDYDDIRGMSLGQKIGNVGTNALSGAATGMQIAGPWGALAGGVVGAGASLAGILSGDKKARTEEGFLNAKADMASDMALNNLNAAHERLADINDRKGVVNAVAKGGQIDRRQMTLKQFMDSKTRKPAVRSERSFGNITRSYCNGGVKFRIRAK